MKEIYRTYEDTEIVELATNIECPYCKAEWQEHDMNDCGISYNILCKGSCGKTFIMHFDAN